jgi:hypothetical protein
MYGNISLWIINYNRKKMIIGKEAQISLDFIMPKIRVNGYDYSGKEFDCLAHVYGEITKMSTGKERVLSKGCQGCIPGAVHIVNNYLRQLPTETIQPTFEGLSLPELRKLHPTIKATSRKSFISKIK